MQKSTDGKLPNKRKFGIIPYLREKIRTQRECRILQEEEKQKREGYLWYPRGLL